MLLACSFVTVWKRGKDGLLILVEILQKFLVLIIFEIRLADIVLP